MLQQVLVLAHQLLRSEPAVLIKQVDLEDLASVSPGLRNKIRVGLIEQKTDHRGEQVPKSPEPDIVGEGIVVVGVEVQ